MIKKTETVVCDICKEEIENYTLSEHQVCLMIGKKSDRQVDMCHDCQRRIYSMLDGERVDPIDIKAAIADGFLVVR